ncbi:MAG: dihydroxyacetone kinase subunit DhaL [Litorilinea sp.]
MNHEITLEQFRRWLILYAQLIAEAETRLTELDAAIGDADHGINMQRGMTRVHRRMEALAPPATNPVNDRGAESAPSPAEGAGEAEQIADIGTLLRHAAMTLISSVGGAAGPLYGAFFLWAAKSVGAVHTADLNQLAIMLRSGLDGVQQRGKAQPGEKTMIDTLAPAIDALEKACAQGLSLDAALAQAVSAAEAGMESTVAMQAHKGRASYLGPRSIGHPDPGAASAFLLVRAAATCLSSDYTKFATPTQPINDGESAQVRATTGAAAAAVSAAVKPILRDLGR